jgi:hypothetical protein
MLHESAIVFLTGAGSWDHELANKHVTVTFDIMQVKRASELISAFKTNTQYYLMQHRNFL